MIGEELFISVGGQAATFLKACFTGAKIAVLYELFRFFRCILKHSEAAVAVEDVFFCVAAAIYSFNFWLYAAKGEMRGFIIVGEWIGAALYFVLPGRIAVCIEKRVSKSLRKLLSSVKTAIKPLLNLVRKARDQSNLQSERKRRKLAFNKPFRHIQNKEKFSSKKRKIKRKTS